MSQAKTTASRKKSNVVQPGSPDVIAQFETAMTELEQIVTELEQGEQSLDHALKDYERGTKLARQCQLALKQAEQRIAELASDESESPPADTTGNQDLPF